MILVNFILPLIVALIRYQERENTNFQQQEDQILLNLLIYQIFSVVLHQSTNPLQLNINKQIKIC